MAPRISQIASRLLFAGLVSVYYLGTLRVSDDWFMNPLEFAEAFAALLDTALASWGLYFTAISGYLIVAYLVGERLTRAQLIIISSLFVVIALAMTFTGFSLSERAIQLEVEFEGERDALDSISYFMLVAQILGVFAALKFMVDVRKGK